MEINNMHFPDCFQQFDLKA